MPEAPDHRSAGVPERVDAPEVDATTRLPAHAIRPTRVEVSLAALADNARAVRGVAGVPLYAVVKADGYGHGALGVARALSRAGVVDGLAVSLVEEGVQLRQQGVKLPILVMGPALGGGHDELVARDLTPVVSDLADLEALAAVGRRRGRPVDIHLKVDTGMSRLGVPDDAVGEIVAGARAAGGVAVVGLMTHLANADVDDPAAPGSMTRAQLARFGVAERAARAAGAALRVRHAANSSGAMAFPEARLDLVRVGLALYGNGHWPADDTLAAPRRQVMRLVTEIVQLRDVAAGATVGYGGLWRAERPSRVAVLPLGYADGLPRRATGTAAVLIHGRRCPLVGAISMDIAIADVTDLADHGPPAAIGDEAVLLGEQRGAHITVAEYAGHAQLTEYEVTCGMSKRVPRIER
ncbi:MAG: alanine racemase [Kofleriaceae bacterium]|nr:alanine racemase [Kofleriaceae bacterium]